MLASGRFAQRVPFGGGIRPAGLKPHPQPAVPLFRRTQGVDRPGTKRRSQSRHQHRDIIGRRFARTNPGDIETALHLEHGVDDGHPGWQDRTHTLLNRRFDGGGFRGQPSPLQIQTNYRCERTKHRQSNWRAPSRP